MSQQRKLPLPWIIFGLLGVLVVAILIGGGFGNALATAGWSS